MEEDPVYTRLFHKWSMRYRRMIDRQIIYKGRRWSLTFLLLLGYVYRIFETQSYFVVTYMMCLFSLQQFIRYITPLGLPDVEEDEEEIMDMQLPSRMGDRPLLRSVNEVTLWEQITFAIFMSIIATYFSVFDLPVYWPFLFSYFIMLVIMTFKKYFRHMHKYGYSFSDFGKSRSNR